MFKSLFVHILKRKFFPFYGYAKVVLFRSIVIKNKYLFIESYTLFFLKSFNKTNEKYKLYLMCISHNTYHFKAEHYGSKSRLSPTLYVPGGQFPLCIKDPRWSYCRCFLEQLNRQDLFPLSPLLRGFLVWASKHMPSLGNGLVNLGLNGHLHSVFSSLDNVA